MHDYADRNGSLPPAAIYAPDGKPLLSWRVQLLPYLGDRGLFDQFHLDEPWDSPHNLTLLPKMPCVFKHFHGRTTPQPFNTYFRVFVGPGAAFEGPNGISLKDFSDGTSNTLLIAEGYDAVPWTQPNELVFVPNGLPCLSFQSDAAFADGSTQTFRRVVAEKRLRALITRSGGEPIETHWPEN